MKTSKDELEEHPGVSAGSRAVLVSCGPTRAPFSPRFRFGLSAERSYKCRVRSSYYRATNSSLLGSAMGLPAIDDTLGAVFVGTVLGCM